jgi:hypothetical protein
MHPETGVETKRTLILPCEQLLLLNGSIIGILKLLPQSNRSFSEGRSPYNSWSQASKNLVSPSGLNLKTVEERRTPYFQTSAFVFGPVSEPGLTSQKPRKNLVKRPDSEGDNLIGTIGLRFDTLKIL